MKKLRLTHGPALAAGLLAGALFLSGCYSLSVNPFYDESSLVFEPGLVGVWGDPAGAEDGTWEFRPAGDLVYRLIIREGDNLRIDPKQDAAFEARLVRLDGGLFLDLFPEEPAGTNDFFNSHIVPAHSFWQVKLEGHVLTLGLFDGGVVEQAIQDGTLTIDHVKRDGVLVFTAPTAALQEMVTRYRDQLFEEGETMQRVQ